VKFGILAVATLAACSPGGRGTLHPVASAGVELTSTHGLPDDTARLSAGDVTADVTGSWTNTNETVEVSYRAPVPTRFPLNATSTWQGQAVRASAAWNRSAPAAGNAIGQPLLEQGRIELAGGATTTVQIEFARPGDDRPAIGDEVSIAVPMPGGARTVRLRVAAE